MEAPRAEEPDGARLERFEVEQEEVGWPVAAAGLAEVEWEEGECPAALRRVKGGWRGQRRRWRRRCIGVEACCPGRRLRSAVGKTRTGAGEREKQRKGELRNFFPPY